MDFDLDKLKDQAGDLLEGADLNELKEKADDLLGDKADDLLGDKADILDNVDMDDVKDKLSGFLGK